jgi:hypothetical protein
MKKRIGQIVSLLSGLAALCLLAACNGPLDAPTAAAGKTGRVYISIAFPGEAAASRTLLPEWEGLNYKLEFIRQGETEPELTRTITTATTEQDLEPGVVYTLKVAAYKTDPAVPAAGGSVSGVTAQAGQPVTIAVPLALNNAGTGALNYALALPGGMTLAGGSLTLYPLPSGADPTYIDLDAEPGGIQIPSGYYRAQFSVYGSTGSAVKFAAKTEVLHISDSLTTTASYTLTADDFADTDLAGDKLYVAENLTQLENALNSISDASETVFTILVNEDISSPPLSLTASAYDGKTVILRGSGGGPDGGIRKISLSSQGSLFTIGAGDSEPVFILRDITLKGITSNNTALLLLDKGELIMESGAVVTGNAGIGVSVKDGNFTMRDNASVYGNTGIGVSVGIYAGNASFTMRDNASVHDNTGGVYVGYADFVMKDHALVNTNTTSASGGGVRIMAGNFTMRDNASVSGNTACAQYGGGVYIENGTFVMEGSASVSGNEVKNNSGTAYGGGVYRKGGTFTMRDNASVNGNTASASGQVRGGGVYVENGDFTMEGSASVNTNTASSSGSGAGNAASGGGVYVDGGNFAITGNVSVSGNTVSASGSVARGGGVCFLGGSSGGTFSMQGDASISGNRATSLSSSAWGGGVFLYTNGTTLTKTGGVIYGSNETGTDPDGQDLKNTAQSQGNAIARGSSSGVTNYRNTTVGTDQNLSTGKNDNWSD